MNAAIDQLRQWKLGVVFAALAITAAALACLGVSIWRRGAPEPVASLAAAPAPYSIQWVDGVPAAENGAAPELVPARRVVRSNAPTQPVIVEPGESAWEQQIAAVLADSEHTESVKARTLLAMLPVLPEELLQMVTQAAVERLRDEDYAANALPLLLNTQTHGMIASVLFDDLLERPDNLTLPALLALARTPDHPFAAAAQTNLELLLGRDFDEDWTQWEAEVQRRLIPQPN